MDKEKVSFELSWLPLLPKLTEHMGSLLGGAGETIPAAARLLRTTSLVLDLSYGVLTTAFALLHQCASAGVDVDCSHEDLAAGCLFVAAKVEEATISSNLLLNTVRCLSATAGSPQGLPRLAEALALRDDSIEPHDGANGATGASASAVPAAEPAGLLGRSSLPAPLVGEPYYTAKARLLWAEQVVLRLSHFEVTSGMMARDPSVIFLNLAPLACASYAAVATGLCLLNDALTVHGAPVTQGWPPEQLACAALLVAAHMVGDEAVMLGLSGPSDKGPVQGPPAWLEASGVDVAKVESIAEQLVSWVEDEERF